MATSTRDETTSSSSSPRTADSAPTTPAAPAGSQTFANIADQTALPPGFPLTGGRYAVFATSTPPGALGLELQLPDGSTTSFVQNSINAVGQNMSFAQAASVWMLPPGTYQVVANVPFTGGNLTIIPF